MDADYYAVLGVDRTEELQGIQTAYRKLAMQCHPDRAGAQGKEQFQAIQEAYEVLSDPGKRKAYDTRVARRPRRQGAGGITPEPLMPSHHPFNHPEPLARPDAPAEDICAPASSRCPFCHEFRNGLEAPCPFCQGFDPMEHHLAEFLMGVLRAFRSERF